MLTSLSPIILVGDSNFRDLLLNYFLVSSKIDHTCRGVFMQLVSKKGAINLRAN